MTKTEKVVVIGLDGATWTILDPLIKKGKLPFLKKLRETGATGTLTSPLPSISATAWASFQTGNNPGKHGIFNFFKRRANPSNPDIINANDIHGKKLWQYLNDHHLKTLLINMPISYPVEPINGVITSSFLTPNNASFLHPDSLKGFFKKQNYQIDIQSDTPWDIVPNKKMSPEDSKRIIRQVKEICNTRADTFIKLIKNHSFDFFFIYFKATDTIQHLFYQTKILTDFWIFLDSLLENIHHKLNTLIEPKPIIFTISDHGFHKISTTHFAAYPHLNSILKPPKSLKSKLIKIVREANKQLKKSGVNLSNLHLIQRKRNKILNKMEKELSNTHAGFIPSPEGIYLFGKTRNKTSISTLINKTKDISLNGRKVFSVVKAAQEIYTGEQINNGPDIIWQTYKEFSLDLSPLSNKIFTKHQSHLRGEHFSDREGIIIATGQDIASSNSLNSNLEDLLPTILHLYNIPISPSIDGKVIDHIQKSFMPTYNNLASKIKI